MQLSGELASCRQQLRATQDELEQALAGVEAARARAARFGQLLQQWVSAARVVQDEVLRQQTASREQAGQWSSQYVQMLQVIDGLLARSAGSTRYA